MAGFHCSSDLLKCALNSKYLLHRILSFHNSRPIHFKYLFDSSRRSYSHNHNTISPFGKKIPKNIEILLNNSHFTKSFHLNKYPLRYFSSVRFLSSKSSNTTDDKNKNTPNDLNDNNQNKENDKTNININIKPNENTTKSAINKDTSNKASLSNGKEVGVDEKNKLILNGANSSLDDYSEIGFETSIASSKEDHDNDIKEKEIVMKVDMDGWKRIKTDFSKIYTDNIFVPLTRAMPEYLLENSELEKLAKYTRRSPYPKRDNITVFKKIHLEGRAIDKWGSLENLQLQKDFLKARIEKKNQVFYLDDKESPYSLEKPYLYQPQDEEKLQDSAFHNISSARVVMFAVACNSLNCLMKLMAWLYTGSHSMFSEFIHSAADTINQVILAIGIKQSMKEADPNHPYGWMKVRNVSSLISGVGIFCVGSGLSIYHGIHGLLFPAETTSLYWALATLCASFLSEGGSTHPFLIWRNILRPNALSDANASLRRKYIRTFLVATRELQKGSKKANMSMKEYLMRGIDPTTTVVLMEDAAAVLGILIAGTCISITQMTGSGIPDAAGSLLIGTLLGGVASFIIYTNTNALVGKSIPAEKRLALVQELESDRMIRTLIDVKATEAGGRFVRFKAEVDFDGREVTRWYLEGISMEKLYEEMKAVESIGDAEVFMLNHGEKVIDALGSAVDRIEKNLKKKHPEIRHCDLEQL